ncbi:MAG: hypothetical protein RM368_28605 [Nostoc sp. DedSLP03]|nr:hypothetical protein [Nostoc sp. DedSLP03]
MLLPFPVGEGGCPGEVHRTHVPLAIAPTQSYRQFSVKMLLLSEFLGTIGLSDDKLAACLLRK